MQFVGCVGCRGLIARVYRFSLGFLDFRVAVLGAVSKDSGFRVLGLETPKKLEIICPGFRVQGSGFRV